MNTPRYLTRTRRLIAVCAIALLAPAAANAQSSWITQLPPEQLLHWQPRTAQEIAQPQALFARPLAGLAEARPSATLAVSPSGLGTWQELGAPPRLNHTLVLDSRRHRMLLLGGSVVMDPQASIWSCSLPSGDWAQIASLPWAATGNTGQTTFSSAVYDSLRDRLIVLSNDGAWQLDALDLGGTHSWSHVWTGPTAMHGAQGGLVIDTRREALALLGVWDATDAAHHLVRVPLGDPAAWTSTPILGTQPPSAGRATTVYDASRDEFFVMFTKYRWGPALYAVGGGDAPTWTAVSMPGTLPEIQQPIVFDAANGRLVFVDGSGNALARSLADGSDWWITGGSWRYAAAALIDPASHQLILEGGAATSDVWEADMAYPLSASATLDYGMASSFLPPSEISAAGWLTSGDPGLGSRIWHSAMLDAVGQQIVVYGCVSRFMTLPQAMARPLSGAGGWTELGEGSDSLPRARFMQAVALDPQHRTLVLFGGQATDGTGDLLGDLWTLPLAAGGHWQRVTVAGPAPGGRRNAALVYDASHSRFLLLGGDNLHGFLGDAWELRFGAVPAWRQIATSGPAPAYQALYVDDSRGDAWSATAGAVVRHVTLGGDMITFEDVPQVGVAPSSAAVAGFDPVQRRMLWVGNTASSDFNVNLSQAWTTNLGVTAEWVPGTVSGVSPQARYLMATVFDPLSSRLLLCGGYQDMGSCFGDTWVLPYQPLTPTAALVSLVDAASDAQGVRLRWDVSAPSGTVCTVERSSDAVSWIAVGGASWTASNQVRFDDAPLAVSTRAAYRLRITRSGADQLGPVVWVSGPAAGVVLSIAPFSNPCRGTPSLSLAVPPGASAHVRLLDVSGRVVSESSVPAGTLRWSSARTPSPGLYFAELVQGSRRSVTRVVVAP